MPRASLSRVSMPGAPAAYTAASGMRLRDLRDAGGWHGVNPCDLRLEQRIQDDQEQIVFEHLFEDMSAPAPATAHVGVTLMGGVSGPYPWRRPV